MDLRGIGVKAACACVMALVIAACSSDDSNAVGGADASPDVKRESASFPDTGRPDVATQPEAGVCAPLALPCDGPEDCPAGNHCCGTLGMDATGGIAYSSVACLPSCGAGDAGGAADAGGMGGLGGLGGGLGLMLELCHAGDTCEDSTTQCSSSMYLPAFIYRCYTMGTAVPATATGGAGVHCGAATCGAGEECCLRAPGDPYCAPAGEACSCAGPAGADGGSDADAASTETGTDGAPEASEDAVSEDGASADSAEESTADAANDGSASDGASE